METGTAPTLQSPESGWPDENLVDARQLVKPWKRLPDITFASPGGRGKQGPGGTSIVGPQTPTDWLHGAKSTQAPISPPPSAPTDSSVPGRTSRTPTDEYH